MLSFTLDTNCLIALERGWDTAPSIRALADAHRRGAVSVAAVFSSASENPRFGQGEASTIQGFLDLLARIDLADVVVLSALMIFDFSFWDTCLWGSDDDRAREAEVQGILFPSIAADYGMYCRSRGLDPSRTPIDKTWRNAKCDVQMMWAHLHHGRDVFVTSDDNFHKESKQPALIALGAGRILTPPDAATLTAS